MLDETLIVWATEFGRTPFEEANREVKIGRGHHHRGFTLWMAGAGIREGYEHGETDDFSYNIVRDPVHINDLNATVLHQLGIDHQRFTYPYQGLEQRLTGVEEPRVVTELLT